jgi:RNA polymerase sigma-70 factor, ECF subfamily
MSIPETDALDGADMSRLADGHDAALNALMERHGAPLFRFLCRMVGDEEDANDLAQEAFVRAYRHRADFQKEKRFSTWLYTIAANLARNHLRWRARHPHRSLDAASDPDGEALKEHLADAAPNPGDSLQAAERVKTIRDALVALPEDLRTPLLLSEYEGFSQAEIGEILHCSAKAVEMRIYRARQQLRQRLAGLLS